MCHVVFVETNLMQNFVLMFAIPDSLEIHTTVMETDTCTYYISSQSMHTKLGKACDIPTSHGKWLFLY